MGTGLFRFPSVFSDFGGEKYENDHYHWASVRVRGQGGG